MESFFAGACTWQKILLSLQVWNLFAFSEQIRDCRKIRKSSAIGKEDSYERNPSGVSFVCNHRFFRTFHVLKNRTQLVKKAFFDKLEFVRFQRTNYARGRLQAFCPKRAKPFLDSLTPSPMHRGGRNFIPFTVLPPDRRPGRRWLQRRCGGTPPPGGAAWPWGRWPR